MQYGTLTLNLTAILEERGISKNKLCKDLDISRSNLNKYCRGEFQRIDTGILCKLLYYLDVDMNELIQYHHPEETS